MAQIEAAGITDNVVDLMAGKICRMSPLTRQALQIAACIGNRFALTAVSYTHLDVYKRQNPLCEKTRSTGVDVAGTQRNFTARWLSAVYNDDFRKISILSSWISFKNNEISSRIY